MIFTLFHLSIFSTINVLIHLREIIISHMVSPKDYLSTHTCCDLVHKALLSWLNLFFILVDTVLLHAPVIADQNSKIQGNHNHINYSPTRGYLGCYQFLDIIVNAITNILMYISAVFPWDKSPAIKTMDQKMICEQMDIKKFPSKKGGTHFHVHWKCVGVLTNAYQDCILQRSFLPVWPMKRDGITLIWSPAHFEWYGTYLLGICIS